MESQTELERRFALLLARFRGLRRRHPRLRPFGLEWWGDPKAGKTTMKDQIQRFLKRSDWNVAARPEGAEVVDRITRDTPHYNLQTLRYALNEITERQHSDFDLCMLDRGPMDHLVWLDYWLDKREIDEDDYRAFRNYCLTKTVRGMFDLHVLMVCEPEVSIAREVAHALTKKDGDTMNPKTLGKLHCFHLKLWQEFGNDPRLTLHDSSKETMVQTAEAALTAIADAFERRLATIK